MNWKQATLGQLYEIAYHDTGCALKHKVEARDEIHRRQMRKRANIRYKAMGRNHG